MTYSALEDTKMVHPAPRLMRGPPPSPPQSTDGDLASEVPQETADYPAIYGYQSTYGDAGQANDIYIPDQSDLSIVSRVHPTSLFAGANRVLSNLQNINASGYSQDVSLHHPVRHLSQFASDTWLKLPQIAQHGVQVNTPPDDGFIAGSVESIPAWPSRSRRATPSRARVHKEARQRKRTRLSKSKDTELEPELTGPLSEMTAHLTHIPLKDQEAYVNRSTEERHAEVEQSKKKKIPRAMNSFILYRSAYAERTKELFRHQNHQFVSKVAGRSWAMETTQVKSLYTRLAVIEKENQKLAFPDYRYTPSKKGSDSDRSRRTPSGSPALGHSSVYSSPEIDQYGFASGTSTPFDELTDHGLPDNGYFAPLHTSQPSYTSHPARPTSAMVFPEHQYMQPQFNPNVMAYHVQDVHSSSTLAGVPGGAHHELFQPQGPMATQGHFPGAPLQVNQVDPAILGLSNAQSDDDRKGWHTPDGVATYYPHGSYQIPSPSQYSHQTPGNSVVQAMSRDSDPSLTVPASAGTEFDGMFIP
ncbi:hypothetical protein BJY04DRAFT_152066 [Aspergillus karnatakaensis]|uniref:HMG-box domain-containing protein n=1 Tax=Aspergillus karnatakaensis TaxID=1810916 RepID=UPI003CCD8F6C